MYTYILAKIQLLQLKSAIGKVNEVFYGQVESMVCIASSCVNVDTTKVIWSFVSPSHGYILCVHVQCK